MRGKKFLSMSDVEVIESCRLCLLDRIVTFRFIYRVCHICAATILTVIARRAVSLQQRSYYLNCLNYLLINDKNMQLCMPFAVFMLFTVFTFETAIVFFQNSLSVL